MNYFSRNKFFVKFPGRDLHGVTGFLQGFTTNAWLTGLLALLTVPLFLTMSAKILTFFSIPEKRSFPYPWTVFTYLNAFAQKVSSHFGWEFAGFIWFSFPRGRWVWAQTREHTADLPADVLLQHDPVQHVLRLLHLLPVGGQGGRPLLLHPGAGPHWLQDRRPSWLHKTNFEVSMCVMRK